MKCSQNSFETAGFYANIDSSFSSCLTIHLAVDAHGMPVRFFVTDATVADCSIAEKLIAEFQAEYLLADRGYDTDAIIQHALQAGMTPVIPPKKNRNVLRNYDKDIYS